MKKTAQILALILLLALSVSVFAIFPVSAAETSTANDETPKLIFSLDAVTKNQDKVAYGSQSTAGGNSFPNFIKKTAEDGAVYYNMGYTGWNPEDNYVAKDSYLSTYANGDITSAVFAGADKDTDYLILDFDFAIDGTEPTDLFYLIRYSNKVDNHIQVTGDPAEGTLTVTTTKNGGAHTSKVQAHNNGWAHITVIWDFHNKTTADTSVSGAPIYVYIDGVSASGSQAKCNGVGVKYSDSRLAVNKPAGVTGDVDSSVALANFTIKTLPAGYKGTLTQLIDAGLVKQNGGVTLGSIPELAYTQENAPGAVKVADVKRGDETIAIYGQNDLDANLLPGDHVILRKNISNTLIVPGVMVDGVLTSAVTFEDNGFTVENPAPVLFADGKYECDWIVRDGKTGALTESKGASGNNNVMYEALRTYANGVKGAGKVTFLNDNVEYGINQADIYYTYIFDLNGKTVTKRGGDNGNGRYNLRGGQVVFRDGVYHDAAGDAFVFVALGGSANVFMDEVIATVDLWSDLRQKFCFTLYRSELTVNSYFNMRMSNTDSTNKGYVNAIESRLIGNPNTQATTVLFNLYSHHSNSIDFNFIGSEISNTHVFADVTLPAADGADVKPVQNFNIVNSTFTASALVRQTVDSSITKAKSVDIKTTAKIYNSTVSATANLIYCSGPNAASNAVDVEIYNSKIAVGADKYLINRTTASTSSATVDILGGNVELNKAPEIAGNQPNSTVILPAGAKAVGQNNVDYPFTVTTDYSEFVYKDLAGNLKTEFWSAKDTVKVEDIVKLPTPAGKYDKYEWQEIEGVKTVALVPNFKVQANLTLQKDISLNVFLPFLEGSGLVDTEAVQFTVDGAENWVVTENKGVTKVQIKGITPEDIDKVFTIKVTVSANGATVTKEVPVSIELYCDKVLADEDEGSAMANLMNAIKDYGNAADAYNAGTLTGDAEVNYGEAKAPAASTVFTDVNLNLNAGFIWKVAVAEGVETVNAKYSYNGEAVEAELKVVGGKVTVEQKAFDLGKDITLTALDESITFNFAFYAEAAIAAAGEDAAKVEGMLDATWKYAVAAAAIKA